MLIRDQLVIRDQGISGRIIPYDKMAFPDPRPKNSVDISRIPDSEIAKEFFSPQFSENLRNF